MQAPMAQGLKTLERLRRGFAPTAREFAPTTDEKVVKCSRLEHLEAEVLAFGTGSLRSARSHVEHLEAEVLAFGTRRFSFYLD